MNFLCILVYAEHYPVGFAVCVLVLFANVTMASYDFCLTEWMVSITILVNEFERIMLIMT